jgi:hypothetical protein
MDPYEQGVLQEGSDAKWEPVRRAMGVTRRLAERVNLATLVPRPELASSRYCLAHPGQEYLVDLPDDAVRWLGEHARKPLFLFWRLRRVTPCAAAR